MINNDPLFNIFLKRFYRAICREKFNRIIPYKNTPTNVPNARKFYFYLEEKKVFVVYSDLLFEKILIVFWSLARNTKNYKQKPIQLLRQCYEDKGVQSSIDHLSWKKTFCTFYKALIEESFFYFDDSENQFYVNLFRNFSNEDFTGGILHSLTRHFKDFNKYTTKPNGEIEFDYNSLFVSLIICSVNGEIIKREDANTINDYKITKKIAIGTKYLHVVYYWDNKKKLFIFTTASIRNK